MKTCWLNQQDNQDCILFMSGWGMVPEPFLDIASGPVDVLMVYDYRIMDNGDFSALFLRKPEGRPHKKIHLLAWSMGVWAAAMLVRNGTLPRRSFNSTTAVGGTCQPIHDQFGIPEQVFDRTVRDLSPTVLAEFYRSMFDSDRAADQFLRHMATKRSVKELRQELIALRAACGDLPDASGELADVFKNRIVTGRDRVFPARNQMRAWGRKTCVSVALPHFPFYQWSSWAELLKIFTHPA